MPLGRPFGRERLGSGLVDRPKTMPIRINLLAEAQTAEELRRKNPVKRGIWVGSFLVCVVIIWIGNLEWEIVLEKHDYARIESDWQTNMVKYAVVTNELSKTRDVEGKLGELASLSSNRFLWAPVLNALQQTMVDEVQVTRVKGEQILTKEDPVTIGTGATARHIPGAAIEKISLHIEAKDLKPGDENYNKYKKNLSASDYFAARLQGRGFIMDGILGPLTVDPVDPSKQFVTFPLATQFPEARHNE
jgi:hypothetical protein